LKDSAIVDVLRQANAVEVIEHGNASGPSVAKDLPGIRKSEASLEENRMAHFLLNLLHGHEREKAPAMEFDKFFLLAEIIKQLRYSLQTIKRRLIRSAGKLFDCICVSSQNRVILCFDG
jgi:hypothetical protein